MGRMKATALPKAFGSKSRFALIAPDDMDDFPDLSSAISVQMRECKLTKAPKEAGQKSQQKQERGGPGGAREKQ